jgi:ribonuclease BN (tRNA processing enzyme)
MQRGPKAAAFTYSRAVRVTLLGSGGWIPTRERETCCALVRDGDAAVLIDAGTGVSRLLERPDLLEGAAGLDIVLTHFHLDHVAGLAYLPAVDVEKRLWAPGAWLYGVDSAALLARLLDPPLFAFRLPELVESVGEIDEQGLELGGLPVGVRVQERHTHPTLALRVGEQLAYCTDTAYDEGNVGFAAGASLLCHEAWHAAPDTDDAAHTASGEAARIAREAVAGELVMIHVNPLLGSDADLLAAAAAEFERSRVGEDLLEWSTPS